MANIEIKVVQKYKYNEIGEKEYTTYQLMINKNHKWIPVPVEEIEDE